MLVTSPQAGGRLRPLISQMMSATITYRSEPRVRSRSIQITSRDSHCYARFFCACVVGRNLCSPKKATEGAATEGTEPFQCPEDRPSDFGSRDISAPPHLAKIEAGLVQRGPWGEGWGRG